MKNNFEVFLYYRVWQNSGNSLLGSTTSYGNRYACYKIISVTPNRLSKTQFFEKKAIFPAKKFFRPIFCCIIEQDRRQGTIYQGPHCNLTVIGQVIRSFL